MYRSCGFPGCQVLFGDCEIHHVIAWFRRRGPTMENLLPLCNEHHHRVHERGWHLSLHPDRRITLHHPDGTTAHDGLTPDVAPTTVTGPDLIGLARQRIGSLIDGIGQTA